MGYTTDFTGQFDLDKPLDDETYEFLCKFNSTRRMNAGAVKMRIYRNRQIKVNTGAAMKNPATPLLGRRELGGSVK